MAGPCQDYEEEVIWYRNKVGLNRKKRWYKPSRETIKYPVRILGMDGREDFTNVTYCVLWDNGFMMDDVEHKEISLDGPELLKEFLTELGISAEI